MKLNFKQKTLLTTIEIKEYNVCWNCKLYKSVNAYL